MDASSYALAQSPLSPGMLSQRKITAAAGELTRQTAQPQPAGMTTEKMTEIRETAKTFEGILLGQLTTIMLQTVPVDEDFGGGSAEEMYRGMMAEEIGQEMARSGGLRLSDALVRQMIALQQGQD